LPLQLGVHVGVLQVPLLLQTFGEVQVPQEPPQPLSPHCLPEQLGVQVETHWPEPLQLRPEPQVPQLPPQPSLPQLLLVQFGVHDAH
jgi:hypothetical protein